MLPAEPPLIRGSAGSAKVCGGKQPEGKTRYRKQFFSNRMSDILYILCRLRAVCPFSGPYYLAKKTESMAIYTLNEQDALTKPASPITTAVMADVGVHMARSLLSSTMTSREKDWTVGNLVEFEKRKQIAVRHPIRD